MRQGIIRTSGEARNLRVGGHVTNFQILGKQKTEKFEDLHMNLLFLRGFRNFLGDLCLLGSYTGFATNQSQYELKWCHLILYYKNININLNLKFP
jgi:hypothetical protein